MIEVWIYRRLSALSWKLKLIGMWFYRRALEREIARTGSCSRIAEMAER